MKIYTRTGDDGTTSLSGGKRIPKHDIRIEAYGSVDELISWVGLLRNYKQNRKRKKFLKFIQHQLMMCVAALANDDNNSVYGIKLPDPGSVSAIELEIDKMEKNLKPLDCFIIPGGNKLVSYCHIARCVCRRAEREVIKLNLTEPIPEIIPIFLNRLSDFLFVLARKICLELDIKEIRWSS